MALVVEHVGQYGAHAVAKRSGIRKGDIIISYDGQTDLLSESDIFFYGNTKTKIGDRIQVALLRNGKKLQYQLPVQR